MELVERVIVWWQSGGYRWPACLPAVTCLIRSLSSSPDWHRTAKWLLLIKGMQLLFARQSISASSPVIFLMISVFRLDHDSKTPYINNGDWVRLKFGWDRLWPWRGSTQTNCFRAGAVLGLSSQEVVGRMWWDLAHPADQHSLKEVLSQVLKVKEQSFTVNCRLGHKNGEYIPFSVSAYKFLNPYSDEFEYVVATHSLTTRFFQTLLHWKSFQFQNMMYRVFRNSVPPPRSSTQGINKCARYVILKVT